MSSMLQRRRGFSRRFPIFPVFHVYFRFDADNFSHVIFVTEYSMTFRAFPGTFASTSGSRILPLIRAHSVEFYVGHVTTHYGRSAHRI